MENIDNSIKLGTLLSSLEAKDSRIKIKFNKHDGNNHPLDLYLRDPEIVNSTWLFWTPQKRYFYQGDIAICLVEFDRDKWLLTTIKKITKDFNLKYAVNHEGEEIEDYKPFFGRVIISYHKSDQTQGFLYETIKNKLIVSEVLADVYSGEPFTGYNNVCLNYDQLEIIVKRQKSDWVVALKNQKAVYLITDKSNGKQYVGSATSDNGMLLSRWSDYINDGHANNKKLKELIGKEGIEYAKKNFQFTILENYNSITVDSVILERETWWKEVLQTRIYGYNAN